MERNLNKQTYNFIAAWILICISMTVMVLSGDRGILSFCRWMVACLFVAILMNPVVIFRNLKLPDGGFCFSLSMGLALSFLFTWLITSSNLIPYHTPVCILCLCTLGILLHLYRYTKTKRISPFENADQFRRFLRGFVVFMLIMAIGVYVRGFKPEITSTTEQFMDFGFMQTIYRQQLAIPDDLWFAGEKLNYYYLGQSLAVYLCRLAFVTPDCGYYYMLITIFAVSVIMVGSMVYGFVEAGFVLQKEPAQSYLKFLPMVSLHKTSAALSGLTASLLAFFGGNGHYLVYGILNPIYEKFTGRLLPMAEERYWFASSTAFIGYMPETLDKGKHEFPSYTFVLGDLHAHAVNIMFVIPVIALLLDLSLDEEQQEGIRRFLDPRLWLVGIFLGLFHGTNYWDFPIYFVVAGAVILFCDLKSHGCQLTVIRDVLMKGLLILGISEISILPFTLHFDKMIGGIGIAPAHSPIDKMLILWGLPIGFAVVLFVMTIGDAGNNIRANGDMALYALIPCGFGLILLPELVYVKDIYGEGFERYNTMFKLTYQAYLILAIAAGILMGLALLRRKIALCIILSIYTILSSSYIFYATRQFMGPLTLANRGNCNGAEYLVEQYDLLAEAEAISYINRDHRKSIHIMEGSGSSYTPDNKLSVFTGAQDVVGWDVHEWLWRSYWEPVGIRGQEVYEFYTKGDSEYCKYLVEKYQVNYIFLGPREYARYEVRPEGFSDLYEEVWTSEDRLYHLYFVQ